MNELKHRILAAKKRIEKVEVEELGCEVHLRCMTGAERDKLQAVQFSAKPDDLTAMLALQPLLLSLTMCDEKGRLIFDDPKEVQEMDAVVIDKLSKIALHINGMTAEARADIEKKAQA